MKRAVRGSEIPFETELMQMAFSVAGSRKLELAFDLPPEKVCEFLAYQLSRCPRDLLAHVRRIRHALQHELVDHLSGALLDLFIALGKSGAELRQLMLVQSKGQLSEAFFKFMSSRMVEGLDAYDAVEAAGVSVLGKGVSGRTRLISETTLNQAASLDPFEQALASIEISQLDAARTILEESVLAGTSNQQEQELLLDLYRKTDDRVHFATLYANLGDTQNHAAEGWLALQAYFDELV